MTSESQFTPEQKTPRSEIKTLSLKTALSQFAMVAVMLAGFWWFDSQLSEQSRVADDVKKDADSLSNQIASAEATTGQISHKVDASLADFSGKVKSLESELETIRGNLHLVEQQATDVKASDAVSQANAREVQDRADRVTRRVREFSQSLQTWNQLIEKVRTRPVQSAEEFTRDELTLLDKLFSARHDERGKQWTDRLTILMTPVNKVLDSEVDTVQYPDTVKKIEELAEEVEEKYKTLTRDLDSLRVLMQRFEAPSPPEVSNLQDMVRRNRLAMAGERNVQLVARIGNEQKQLDREMEEAVEESMRSLSDARIASQNLVTTIQTNAIRQEDAIRKQQAQQRDDARRREADQQEQDAARLAEKQKHQREYEQSLPEIHRLLVPFLAAGNRQLNGTDWAQSDSKTPLSYAGIRATGSLTNDRAGHRAFLWLAGGPYNDRPNGVFPAYIGGDVSNFSCMGSIRRGQVLLDKYGELLVAKGLLAP